MIAFRVLALLAGLAVPLAAAADARALCVYQGAMNVQTTLEQEFADSPWVARVRLVGMDSRRPDNDEGLPSVLYHLEVVESFKGDPPRRLEFFTTRDSGGFYLEDANGGVDAAAGDWLLFLQPSGQDEAPPGAVFVNYSCGRSALWSELSPADLATIRSLAGKA